MSARGSSSGNLRATLYTATIGAALTAIAAAPVIGLTAARYLCLHANFVYAAGGTTVKAWIQTSIDGGLTWFDIANFAFTTASGKKTHVICIDPATPYVAGTVPASAALADNTILNGIIGDRLRVLITTTGIYTGATTLAVDVVVKN